MEEEGTQSSMGFEHRWMERRLKKKKGDNDIFLVDLYTTEFQGINNYCLLKVKFDM